ncbi:MAG TPA: HutD family protein [Scandinavium sp.]|jgi:hypothetical protein
MITAFQINTLPVTRWKNGGGETREIVSHPSPDAPFLWRASIATLSADGPFSLFPGVDRVIMLLEGAPLWLRGGEINHHLKPWQPWAFAGEWPLTSEGITRAGLDFNIMIQRDRATARVNVVTTECAADENGVAYVLQGVWKMAGERYEAGSGIHWQDERAGALLPLTDDATLLLAEITII